MTTLHVDLGPQWRGGQNQVRLLLWGLRDRGHSAELVALENSPLARRALADGVPVHCVGRHATRFRAALRLRTLLTHGRFDLLHAHDAHGLTAAWLARAHHRTRIVASRRVVYAPQRNPLALARYRAAQRILAVSRYVANNTLVAGLPLTRIEVVHDGIEIPPLPSPEDRRRARQHWDVQENETLLGCVGYLLPDKGQEHLLRALPNLRARFPLCRLLLVGDGPWRARLARLVHELKLEPAVHFAGFAEDLAQVYAALDLFIFPARAEGLGSSLLTAMAYGLPVVAVASGGVPEVIDHERNGLLVPQAGSAGIESAVARLLSDRGLATRLGLAARSTICQGFSADHMVENTLRVYREVSLPGVTK